MSRVIVSDPRGTLRRFVDMTRETPEQQKARQLRNEIYAHNLAVDIKRKQRKERKK